MSDEPIPVFEEVMLQRILQRCRMRVVASAFNSNEFVLSVALDVMSPDRPDLIVGSIQSDSVTLKITNVNVSPPPPPMISVRIER